MRILEKFWYGNIEPTEYDTSSCKEYKKLLELICRNEEKLQATMTDKHRLSEVSLKEFLRKNHIYSFNDKLFCKLAEHGINEKNFLGYTITQLVHDELGKFYNKLSGKVDVKIENQPGS